MYRRSGKDGGAVAWLQQACVYLAAALLPWLLTELTMRTTVLHQTPLALSFACIVVIATFSGLGQSLVAITSTALAFNYYILTPHWTWSLGAIALLRTAIVLTVGYLVTLLSRQRRGSEKRLRVALASLQERTDALIEAQQGSKSAAWVFTTADRRTHWYEGGAEIYGRTVEELTAMGSPVKLVLAEDWPLIASAAARTEQTGEIFHVEFRVTWPNGEIHWLEARGTPLKSNPAIWRGVTMDITERKLAEQALIRSEKLAAVGRLASTIAHEVNNPLEAVINLLYLAHADTSLSATTRRYLESADQELARLANITRRTLSFVRTKQSKEPVDLGELTENVVAIFRARCDTRGGHIHCVAAPGLRVDVPVDDLRQILTNLVANACDALSGPAGEIEIRTLQEAGAVVILVEDNGIGIPAENLGRIFDAFFTTKDDVGTGIGLWLTKELVENNGGEISVRSGDLPGGYRTSFRVSFPSVKPKNGDADGVGIAGAAAGQSETLPVQ